MGVEPASVLLCNRASVHTSLSSINISKTSGPIAIKFYLKHHLGTGNAALGFEADQLRTLVSIATDSSYRATMGKTVLPFFLGCL